MSAHLEICCPWALRSDVRQDICCPLTNDFGMSAFPQWVSYRCGFLLLADLESSQTLRRETRMSWLNMLAKRCGRLRGSIRERVLHLWHGAAGAATMTLATGSGSAPGIGLALLL